MKPKYDSYEEYVKEHLDFGKTDSATSVLAGHPLLGVDLLDRSTNKHQSLYYSICKTEEELAKAIAICESIIDSGKIGGDLRIYVDYNPVFITPNVLAESAKYYIDLLQSGNSTRISRKVLFKPKSFVYKKRGNASFLLDVDTQLMQDIKVLDSILDEFKLEVLLVNSTKNGFHYIVDSSKVYGTMIERTEYWGKVYFNPNVLKEALKENGISEKVTYKGNNGYFLYGDFGLPTFFETASETQSDEIEEEQKLRAVKERLSQLNEERHFYMEDYLSLRFIASEKKYVLQRTSLYDIPPCIITDSVSELYDYVFNQLETNKKEETKSKKELVEEKIYNLESILKEPVQLELQYGRYDAKFDGRCYYWVYIDDTDPIWSRIYFKSYRLEDLHKYVKETHGFDL